MVKSYNSRAKIALMTNVPLNYSGGDFQYPRHLIIDEYDGIYRKMSKFKGINLLEVNKFLKTKIAQGESDLRIRRYKVPVLSSSMDNSAEARRMGHRLWRTNIHYNTKGSSFVAEFLSTSLLRLR